MSRATVVPGAAGPAPEARPWGLRAATGRTVELSGDADSATLSAAAAVLLEAQRDAEPVAWIAAREAGFYPPDFEDLGIDLRALPVVRVARAGHAARAAEMLLSSGGFTLVVVDLAHGMRLGAGALARLDALARHHRAALLLLTAKSREEPALGVQVALRAEARRRRAGFDRFTCALTVLRDRKHRPSWTQEASCRGPDGLC